MVERPEEQSHRGILAWWAGNSVAANLLMIIALIGGVIGFSVIQRDQNPAAQFAGATVSVAWPGASPQEVEEQIILRIEEAITSVDGVRRITATAVEGSGWVNIEGNSTVDPKEFLDAVKLQVDSINNLPVESFQPRVTQWQSRSQIAGIALHGNIDRRELQRIAREIRNELSASIPEIASVDLQARLPEEVSVEISEENMRRYGVSVGDISRAIGNASINRSAGSVRTDLGDVRIASRHLADTADEFGDIIVRQTPGGGVIRVRDIANVTDGLEDRDFAATFDGEPMVLITLMSTGNSDVIDVSRQLAAYLDRKRTQLPETVSLSEWWDGADQFNSQLTVIGNSALLGLGLVLIVLILFLRPIVAFWVTIGIATAFAGAFMLLPMIGVTLNFLSLFAFLIVIGVVVDDAIIVGENIHNRVERGEQGLTAAVVGVQMVAKPVLFAVITSMLAFAPWMMLSGPEVQFTRQISLVVIAALTFSLIESLLILPAHLAHIKPQQPKGISGGFIRAQASLANTLVWFARNVYGPFLAVCIRQRYATLAVFVGLFGLAVVLMNTNRVPFHFMPEIESDLIQVNIQLAEGTPWQRTEEIRQRLEEAELRVQEAYREEFPGEIDVIRNRSTLATNAQIRAWIGLAPPEIRPGRVPSADIAQRIRDALGPVPDAEEIRFDATINEVGPAIDFAINHPDLDVLRAAADELKDALRAFPATYDVVDNLQTAADELRLTLRPDAQALGLTLSDVTNQVRQAFFGQEVQRLPRDGSDVRVMVRYPREARDSLDSINQVRIRTPDGREIPLAAVAEAEFAPGINRIQRRERQRTVRVSAGVSDPDAARAIRTQISEEFFPAWRERFPGISVGAIGQAEGEAEFMGEIASLQLIMLGLMYVLLAVAFRSYAQPLLIMTAIPFAFAGAVFGHLLLGVPFALFSMFGIGAAAGIVINDNLVLVDFVNRLRERGVGAFQALVDAGIQRFRPILLTTVTTFIGVLPMIAERSTAAQFLKPMVVSLGFAVIFALFLTLFMVPALYAIGVDIKRGVMSLWTGQKRPGIGSGYDGDTSGSDIDVGQASQPAE
ncbi:MAG: efflux RND transporter permease subunit [Oceanicaulis sp.]|uniref:efflux RND transporter permease subunit n=1 Tax=Glycocaulis sp. TaxID=1969725 RepID=UPI0025C09863|nr:efflux RND transporter permease subunit [Glycocaulis sp.]MCC5981056.1 efflux RND transporter permease subunit [Oceanicaulis sp.]MCH8522649.1 efflux RND transporter permease subunit [Glycocaulis sp.]